MKVELDLSTEQLQELDKGLMELLITLTDEQKTEIVKNYLQYKMDNNFYKKSEGYYGGTSVQLTDFGKEVISGLQDKVATNITNELFEDETIGEQIQKTTSCIISNLDEIITKSLVTYITENLFKNSYLVQQQIELTINRMLGERNIR